MSSGVILSPLRLGLLAYAHVSVHSHEFRADFKPILWLETPSPQSTSPEHDYRLLKSSGEKGKVAAPI